MIVVTSLASDLLKMAVLAGFWRKMNLISNKTEKNRKKPVETEEIGLTKSAEKLKVNCGTVLRTRMNTDDFAVEKGCDFLWVQNGSGERAGKLQL